LPGPQAWVVFNLNANVGTLSLIGDEKEGKSE